VVIFGQEPYGRRHGAAGPRSVRQVEELATLLVTESEELRTKPFEDRREPGQSRPCLRICDRRRPESFQVTEHHRIERRRATRPPFHPMLKRRDLGGAA